MINEKNRLPLVGVILGFLLVLVACRGETPTAPPATPTPTLVTFPTSAPRSPTPVPGPTSTLRPSSTPFPTPSPVPSLTPIPTNTPTPGIIGIGEITGPFRDDFSDPLSGWPEASGEKYGYGYLGGAYNMYSNIPYAEVCASRTRSHTDFVVTVKATKNSGPNDAYFGVTCRKTGPNYFSLAINGNGEYRVYRSIGNVRELLVSGASKAIKKGNVTNSLRASCIGSVLTLEVNNREVVQVLDPYNQFGYFVGLVVGTDAEVGINVTFDNFDSFPP